MIIVTSSFSEKLRFQNIFRPAHENVKPACSNSFGFQSVLEELRFQGSFPVLRISVDERRNHRNQTAFSNFLRRSVD